MGLLDFAQAASNAAASTVTGPVDLLSMILQKMGINVGTAPVGGTEWAKRQGLMRDVEQGPAQVAGETAGLLGPVAIPAKAAQIARGLLKMGENAAAPALLNSQRGVLNFDPRFDPRVQEAQRLKDLTTTVEPRSGGQVPTLSLADLEGRPFITSMSDRTAAGGLLTGINDIKLSRPIDLRGGQDFMFDNPGQVWASAHGPVKQIMGLAQDVKRVTGKDPLYLPWRMAPTGGDFASMTGETMLSYAKDALAKKDARQLDKAIKEFIPDWSGVAADSSVQQFRNASDSTRKAIKNMMDVRFRDRGGLGIGEARLSVADPKQYAGADGQLMNVGKIFADVKPAASTHPSYPAGVPGEGLGRLSDELNVFQLLPSVVGARSMPSATVPRATDLRALQMKPYAGLITEDILKALGY